MKNNLYSFVFIGLLCATIVGSGTLLPADTANAQNTVATGNAQRGEALFTAVYKCYACHGFDAQTGQRRLKPMNYTEDGFITFVNNSPLPQMPAYADVPTEDLADVYAYILSIPIDAPEVEDVPLLSDILDRKLESLSD